MKDYGSCSQMASSCKEPIAASKRKNLLWPQPIMCFFFHMAIIIYFIITCKSHKPVRQLVVVLGIIDILFFQSHIKPIQSKSNLQLIN